MRRGMVVALALIVLADAAPAHPDDDLEPDRPLGEFRTEDVYHDELQALRQRAEAARPRAVRSFLRRAVGRWKCTGSSRGTLTLRRVGRSFVVTYSERQRGGKRMRVSLDLARAFVQAGGLLASASDRARQRHVLHWQDADTVGYVVTTGDPDTVVHELTCVR